MHEQGRPPIPPARCLAWTGFTASEEGSRIVTQAMILKRNCRKVGCLTPLIFLSKLEKIKNPCLGGIP